MRNLPHPTLSKGEGLNCALFEVLSFGEGWVRQND